MNLWPLIIASALLSPSLAQAQDRVHDSRDSKKNTVEESVELRTQNILWENALDIDYSYLGGMPLSKSISPIEKSSWERDTSYRRTDSFDTEYKNTIRTNINGSIRRILWENSYTESGKIIYTLRGDPRTEALGLYFNTRDTRASGTIGIQWTYRL